MSTHSAQHPVPKCGWCKNNDGIFTCSLRSDTIPPKVYCSQDCQQSDWPFHMKYCGKIAFAFDLTLVGSSNPVIKRTFDVPSWFTFRQLHYLIQYVMGWDVIHLHSFTFFRPDSSRRKSSKWLPIGNPGLSITTRESLNHEKEFGGEPSADSNTEDTLTLADVYGEGGRLNTLVRDPQSGEVFPLCYHYDFGDNWQLLIEFKGQKLASASRPVVTSATGCAPLEDSGGVGGWDRVKHAFRTRNPDENDEDWKQWAIEVSGLGDRFDPFEEPNMTQMNDEERWKKKVNWYMLMGHDEGEIPI